MENPPPKRRVESAILGFLGGGVPKQSLSKGSAALQNWVIQDRKTDALCTKSFHRKRRDTALIAALCAAPAEELSKMGPKLPHNHGNRSASVEWQSRNLASLLLALLACWRSGGPPSQRRPTANLSNGANHSSFSRANGLPWARAALHNALRRLSVAGSAAAASNHHSGKIMSRFSSVGSSKGASRGFHAAQFAF